MTIRRDIQPVQLQPDPVRILAESRVNGGMITTIDPADIPPGAMAVARNCNIRYDKTSRRNGTVAYGPAKPDSNKILAIYSFKKDDGTYYVLRFTKSGIHLEGAGSWTALTGTLTGGDSDYYNIIYAFNQCVFTNGIDDIKVIDAAVATFADLGNAPKYKYITSFYNRVVAGYFNDPAGRKPSQLGWSGDGNFTQWDGLVDPSAGSSSLIDNPSDTSDDITGVFGGSDVLIIPKQRTIWLATKNPSASNPFRAFTAVFTHGSDAPRSIVRTGYGLVFADTETRKVYTYLPVPGNSVQQAEPISTYIENELFRSVSNVNDLRGSYNSETSEYSLIIPFAGSSVTKIWKFNFLTKTWSYDERRNISFIGNPVTGARALTIGDLVGTIGDLVGTIGDLASTGSPAPTQLYANTNGEITRESTGADTDNGVPYTFTSVSKRFNIPSNDIYVHRINIQLNVQKSGSVTLYYSKDRGKSWKSLKTFTLDQIADNVLLKFTKQIRCRTFEFKLESTSGLFDIIDYAVFVYDSTIAYK